MSRVGIVGMWHETNTYSPRATTMAEFEVLELHRGEGIIDRHAGARTVIGGFLTADGFDPVPVFSAGAWPAGTITADTATTLLEMLAHELERAGPIDGVLANLHGAMVAEGRPDMEADTVEVVRSLLGEVPVVGVVDFHANPSVAFVENIDVLVGYDTYPHVDMWDRGVEAGRWVARLLGGEKFKTRIGKHPLLTTPLSQGTDTEPMASLLRRARENAEALDVERVGITGGFAYSDTERAGLSVLATTDADHAAGADELIARTLADIDSVTEEFTVSRPGPAEAVTAAMAASDKPVVLADVADNVGGGSSGDGTALLSELLAQGASGALSVIADPEIAAQAHRVGVGGTVTGTVGGKTDDLHGPPVLITGEVEALSDGEYVSGGTWGSGLALSMGPTAWLVVDGVDLVVTTRPTPPFHVEQVTHLGIDPAAASIITAKGAVAWRSAYGEVAQTVIEVDTPGVCPIDVGHLPRTTEPVRYP
jgi:microcystin degradation protein MlrC